MIRPEAALLNILVLFDVYNKYRQYIEIKDDRELQLLYQFLDELMGKMQRDVSFNEYCLYVLNNLTKDTQVYKAILEEIAKNDVQPDVAETLLEQLKERNLAHTIALLAIDVTEGRKSFLELSTTINNCSETIKTLGDDYFVSDDLENLYTKHVQKHGLRWRLGSLNQILGSLRKGDFGFIFARPETGKTTFLASEISYFAEQIPPDAGPILWFNNEEEGKKVQLRIFQATLGIKLDQLFSNIKEYNSIYHNTINNKLKLIDTATISKTMVEKYCKEYNPSAIIFDQLDKVKGFTADREDLRLGSIYQWARELAKAYGPVIAVSQADGSGEGKKWLTMENVANAKTAKQAEADWILGIGKTHQDGFEFIRHLHASKNKLTGDLDSVPAMRHGKVDVIIEPEIARYKDYV